MARRLDDLFRPSRSIPGRAIAQIIFQFGKEWVMGNETEKNGEPTLPLGFLQMCIDKRFHRIIQERFDAETGLTTQQYWLHADVGGSPGLAKKRREAPDYCYDNFPALRDMGWSAHGSKCGGFPGEDDEYILKR